MNRVKNLGFRFGAGLVVAGFSLLGAATNASAASVIYSAQTTNLTNMTHQNAYTWQLEGINLGNNTITSAVLTFNGFFNWTSATNDPYNILWVDLLDTSTHTGNGTIASMTDDTNSGTLGINDVLDGFRFGPQGTNVSVVGSSGLVTSGTSRTYFGSSVNGNDSGVQGYGVAPGTLGNNAGPFGTTPVTWSITTTNSTVLTALANYIANGANIALGLDSDCHFGDTNITFQIYGTPNVQQSAVPEPGTMLLVGSGLFAAYRRRRRLSA
ncbi:MAG TPA: PEP-CTERM sorting domain-containing protein [Vicinamibacterales bacterium]|nr:PEP-CTERM sorting domain-containing protein [Vicinamibacterales bacterium]